MENTNTQQSVPAENVDPAEVAKFEAMAAEWWNPEGKFKPLHMLNPCRLGYITSQIGAEFGREQAGEVSARVAEAAGEARHTLALDDAVGDEAHRAGGGVAAEVPLR